MPMDKVFVVGDSHAIALAEGAKRLGANTGMAYLSGNDWHSGTVRFHRKLGLVAVGRPGFQKRMKEACAQLETDSLLQGDHVVLTSLGYQLGRLLPPMRRNGHGFACVSEGDPHPVVSSGFVAATVHAKRAGQIELVRKLARRRRVIVVSPPVLKRTPEDDLVRDIIGSALTGAGAELVDTRFVLPDDGVLPDAFRHEDGIHGNAEYGEFILKHVRENVLANA